MLLSPRARLKPLAAMCRRMATSLEAGVDLRKALDREADAQAPAAQRNVMREMRDSAKVGHSLSDTIEDSGEYFPEMFREMVNVGEETGQLAEVFRHLAHHYERQISLRREFFSAISWPLTQLVAALCTVGLLIWILGWIADTRGGEALDVLGFGLVGERGVTIYFGTIAAIVVIAAALFEASRRGAPWVAPLVKFAYRLPAIGGALTTLALARMAWSMNLTLDTGMPLSRAIPLGFRASGDPYHLVHMNKVVSKVTRGQEIHHALSDTGAFPHDFLDAVRVGEQSGRLPEQMTILSKQYEERAESALATLTQIAGFGVWLMVAIFIVMLIFRIFNAYVGEIYKNLP